MRIVLGFLTLLVLATSSCLAEEVKTLTASNGVTYKLIPSPDTSVPIRPGEKVLISLEKCEVPTRLDWLHEKKVCTSARVVRATKLGIEQTGGEVTLQGPILRMPVLLGISAMLLVAFGLVTFRFKMYGGAILVFFSSVFVIVAAGTLSTNSHSFMPSVVALVGCAISALVLALILDYTKINHIHIGHKRRILKSVLALESVMLLFSYLVW